MYTWKKEEAREEALEKGRVEGIKEFAKNLLIQKLDIAAISCATGLSEEKIKELQKSMESNK